MSEEKIHKEKRMTNRAGVAAELRRLADELESGGNISYGAGGSLAVPDQLEQEFEIEREDRGSSVEYEVEFELKWYVPKGQ
ncbi:MAG TPA: amphi-Trp domain-containing protein [Mycobacterium sp.]|nr:amphi-Trp domain-containing protein [Mycobacterium sp.]